MFCQPKSRLYYAAKALSAIDQMRESASQRTAVIFGFRAYRAVIGSDVSGVRDPYGQYEYWLLFATVARHQKPKATVRCPRRRLAPPRGPQRAGQASRAAEPHTSIGPAFPVWCCPLADRSTALHGRTANSLLSHGSRILWTPAGVHTTYVAQPMPARCVAAACIVFRIIILRAT